ncbi:MAG: hypothetical protein IJA35_05440 [Clostridia bacterium]|nr:hypothetical protein [Clostridia bacterium]
MTLKSMTEEERIKKEHDLMVLQDAVNAFYKKATTPEEAFSQTEARLRAYPIIAARLKDNKAQLEELSKLGVEALKHSSLSIVRIVSPSLRLDPEEVHEVQMMELKARIAADTREIDMMDAAFEYVSEDDYFSVIRLSYFRGLKDGIIGDRICCDRATVRRNRHRLVKKMASYLYGTTF